MNTSDVLNKAADLIEERGWTFGEGWPTAGRKEAKLCLEGGILAASGLCLPSANTAAGNQERNRIIDSLAACPAYRAVMTYLQTDTRWGIRSNVLHSGHARAYDWNDAPDRTAAEVIEVLRATALIEQAREDAALLAEAGRA